MKPAIPFLRTPYNYDTNQAGDECGLACKDKSLAQQHMAEETDINFIVKRYTQTGELPNRAMPPLRGDFEGITSYQDALDLMVAARESFQAMPAEVRSRFDNDPAQFVDFCSNEANRDDLRKWGLYSPEAAARYAQQAQETQDLVEAGKAAREAAKAASAAKGDTKQKGVT